MLSSAIAARVYCKLQLGHCQLPYYLSIELVTSVCACFFLDDPSKSVKHKVLYFPVCRLWTSATLPRSSPRRTAGYVSCSRRVPRIASSWSSSGPTSTPCYWTTPRLSTESLASEFFRTAFFILRLYGANSRHMRLYSQPQVMYRHILTPVSLKWTNSARLIEDLSLVGDEVAFGFP